MKKPARESDSNVVLFPLNRWPNFDPATIANKRVQVPNADRDGWQSWTGQVHEALVARGVPRRVTDAAVSSYSGEVEAHVAALSRGSAS
ncbi:MAG: hypothetical protein B7Y80_13685 [Hyphomicrobium sp. 32-62-53]|nr:MAG: hypothetical protein B7Z29_12540 [Hyphomicrobium sp. 12-62-95]OYX99076.1 MAG: hypothetical protein B7Y80_13685 [Hyphomicrobium sp. 32-62-53]